MLFGRHGRRYRHPPAELVRAIRAEPGISSIQITFHEDKSPEDHAAPPGGFRLAIINSHDLDKGFAARRRLAQAFPAEDLLLPESVADQVLLATDSP